MEIRKATGDDWPEIWPIFHEIVSAGNSYPYLPETTREEGFRIWMEAPELTFLCELDGKVVGTYYIKPNQPGLGSHVCNCGYMVGREARGQGVATEMCRHSQQMARELGYRAMQFNLVVASNARAVRLWRHLEFETIGRLPKAFRTPEGAYSDAFVFYKLLN